MDVHDSVDDACTVVNREVFGKASAVHDDLVAPLAFFTDAGASVVAALIGVAEEIEESVVDVDRSVVGPAVGVVDTDLGH